MVAKGGKSNESCCFGFFSPLFSPRFALRSIKISALISSTLDSQLSAAPGGGKKAGDGKVFSVLGLRFFPLLSPFLTFSSFANFSLSEKEVFCSMLADHKSNFTGEIFMKSRLQAFSVVL